MLTPEVSNMDVRIFFSRLMVFIMLALYTKAFAMEVEDLEDTQPIHVPDDNISDRLNLENFVNSSSIFKEIGYLSNSNTRGWLGISLDLNEVPNLFQFGYRVIDGLAFKAKLPPITTKIRKPVQSARQIRDSTGLPFNFMQDDQPQASNEDIEGNTENGPLLPESRDKQMSVERLRIKLITATSSMITADLEKLPVLFRMYRSYLLAILDQLIWNDEEMDLELKELTVIQQHNIVAHVQQIRQWETPIYNYNPALLHILLLEGSVMEIAPRHPKVMLQFRPLVSSAIFPQHVVLITTGYHKHGDITIPMLIMQRAKLEEQELAAESLDAKPYAYPEWTQLLIVLQSAFEKEHFRNETESHMAERRKLWKERRVDRRGRRQLTDLEKVDQDLELMQKNQLPRTLVLQYILAPLHYWAQSLLSIEDGVHPNDQDVGVGKGLRNNKRESPDVVSGRKIKKINQQYEANRFVPSRTGLSASLPALFIKLAVDTVQVQTTAPMLSTLYCLLFKDTLSMPQCNKRNKLGETTVEPSGVRVGTYLTHVADPNNLTHLEDMIDETLEQEIQTALDQERKGQHSIPTLEEVIPIVDANFLPMVIDKYNRQWRTMVVRTHLENRYRLIRVASNNQTDKHFLFMDYNFCDKFENYAHRYCFTRKARRARDVQARGEGVMDPEQEVPVVDDPVPQLIANMVYCDPFKRDSYLYEECIQRNTPKQIALANRQRRWIWAIFVIAWKFIVGITMVAAPIHIGVALWQQKRKQAIQDELDEAQRQADLQTALEREWNLTTTTTTPHPWVAKQINGTLRYHTMDTNKALKYLSNVMRNSRIRFDPDYVEEQKILVLSKGSLNGTESGFPILSPSHTEQRLDIGNETYDRNNPKHNLDLNLSDPEAYEKEKLRLEGLDAMRMTANRHHRINAGWACLNKRCEKRIREIPFSVDNLYSPTVCYLMNPTELYSVARIRNIQEHCAENPGVLSSVIVVAAEVALLRDRGVKSTLFRQLNTRSVIDPLSYLDRLRHARSAAEHNEENAASDHTAEVDNRRISVTSNDYYDDYYEESPHFELFDKDQVFPNDEPIVDATGFKNHHHDGMNKSRRGGADDKWYNIRNRTSPERRFTHTNYHALAIWGKTKDHPSKEGHCRDLPSVYTTRCVGWKERQYQNPDCYITYHVNDVELAFFGDYHLYVKTVADTQHTQDKHNDMILQWQEGRAYIPPDFCPKGYPLMPEIVQKYFNKTLPAPPIPESTINLDHTVEHYSPSITERDAVFNFIQHTMDSITYSMSEIELLRETQFTNTAFRIQMLYLLPVVRDSDDIPWMSRVGLAKNPDRQIMLEEHMEVPGELRQPPQSSVPGFGELTWGINWFVDVEFGMLDTILNRLRVRPVLYHSKCLQYRAMLYILKQDLLVIREFFGIQRCINDMAWTYESPRPNQNWCLVATRGLYFVTHMQGYLHQFCNRDVLLNLQVPDYQNERKKRAATTPSSTDYLRSANLGLSDSYSHMQQQQSEDALSTPERFTLLLERAARRINELEIRWQNTHSVFINQGGLLKESRSKRLAPLIPVIVGTTLIGTTALAGTIMGAFNAEEIAHIKGVMQDTKADSYLINLIQQHHDQLGTMDAAQRYQNYTNAWLINATQEFHIVRQISTTTDILRDFTDIIEREVNVKIAGLNALLHQQLTTELVNTTHVTRGIQGLKKKAAKHGLGMPIEDLGYLYQLPVSFTVEKDGQLTIFLGVPLQTQASQLFTMYEFVDVPIALEGSPHSISIQPEAKILAYEAQRDGFLFIAEEDLATCQQVGKVYYCPDMTFEYNQPHSYCITSIFMGGTAITDKLCPTAIAPAKVVIQQAAAQSYYVFHPKLATLSMVCSSRVIRTETWRGTRLVEIPASPGCIGRGEGYKLKPVQSVSFNITVVSTVNVWKMKDLTHRLTVPALNAMLPKPPSAPVLTENVAKKYWALRNAPYVFPWTISIFGYLTTMFWTVVIVGTTVMLLYCCCWKKYPQTRDHADEDNDDDVPKKRPIIRRSGSFGRYFPRFRHEHEMIDPLEQERGDTIRPRCRTLGSQILEPMRTHFTQTVLPRTRSMVGSLTGSVRSLVQHVQHHGAGRKASQHDGGTMVRPQPREVLYPDIAASNRTSMEALIPAPMSIMHEMQVRGNAIPEYAIEEARGSAPPYRERNT